MLKRIVDAEATTPKTDLSILAKQIIEVCRKLGVGKAVELDRNLISEHTARKYIEKAVAEGLLQDEYYVKTMITAAKVHSKRRLFIVHASKSELRAYRERWASRRRVTDLKKIVMGTTATVE